MTGQLRGKKAAIIAVDDFETSNSSIPCTGSKNKESRRWWGASTWKRSRGRKAIRSHPKASLDQVSADDFDLLVIPGGKSPERLRLNSKVLEFVRTFDRQGKVIAAICHAGQVLASAGMIKGRIMTCVSAIRDDVINAGANYVDKPAVRDGNLVRSRVPADLPEFAKLTIEALVKPQLVQVSRVN